MHMHRTKCERNSSLGGTTITWSEVAKQNIQAKKSIVFQSFPFQYGPLSFFLPLLQYFSCNSPMFSSHTLVRAQGTIGRATRRALFSPLLKQRRYSCSGPSKELTLLLEMSFKFLNLFGKLTLAF